MFYSVKNIKLTTPDQNKTRDLKQQQLLQEIPCHDNVAYIYEEMVVRKFMKHFK
uniref:Uncharacterized protein n=1 Tax=Octopus bimaculoides TaxID=37653 RepID=A0A0L8I5Y6_OCTBM